MILYKHSGEDLVTSIHELVNTTVSIYPNPAKDFINAIFENQINFQISLHNLQGVLMQKSTNDNHLDLQHLSSGIYLLDIEELASGKRVIERIVVVD